MLDEPLNGPLRSLCSGESRFVPKPGFGLDDVESTFLGHHTHYLGGECHLFAKRDHPVHPPSCIDQREHQPQWNRAHLGALHRVSREPGYQTRIGWEAVAIVIGYEKGLALDAEILGYCVSFTGCYKCLSR